jgi:hypothetical protein
MFVGRPVTDVVDRDFDQSPGASSFYDAFVEWPLEHRWEQGEDID